MTRWTKLAALMLVVLAGLLVVVAVGLWQQPAPVPVVPSATPLVVEVPAPAPPPMLTLNVVVAARDLKPGVPLQDDDLRLDAWPVMPGGGHDELALVVGQVLRLPVLSGAAVTRDALASGLALQLTPGERAVAVSVDEVVGTAHQIGPGDWVDVFFALQRTSDEVQGAQSRLLLPRQRVLAYGEESVSGVPPEAQGSGRTTPAAARTAVLAVALDDVNALMLASGQGRLRLALRHPGDDSLPDPSLFVPLPTVLRSAAASDVLAQPDNRAYAGLDLRGLAAEHGRVVGEPEPRRVSGARTPAARSSVAAPARPPTAAAPARGIEVIRGRTVSMESY